MKVDPTLSEFSLRDAEGDATESLLTRPGRVYMLCVTDSEGLDAPCERRFRGVVERAAAEGALAVCLTPERLRGVVKECDGVKAHIVSVSDELIGYIRKFSDGSILDKFGAGKNR